MMDYFNPFDLLTKKALQKEVMRSDESVLNPVTYEMWEDDGKIGWKATSAYSSSWGCDTKLVTINFVNTNMEEGGDVKESLVVRDFDEQGRPVMWIPKGTRLWTEVRPYDTAGATNFGWTLSDEPQNERAGVSVEYLQFQTGSLDNATTQVMKQERPDLWDLDDMDLEDFEAWWVEINEVHMDTANRVFAGQPMLYMDAVDTMKIRGDGGFTSRKMDRMGLYRVDTIYGYDWESEVGSQKWSWTLGEGDDFLGLSWSGVGYWTLQTIEWVFFVKILLRSTITYSSRMVGGKLVPYVKWGGGFGKQSFTTLSGFAKWLLACAEVIAIDMHLLEFPGYIREVHCTDNHNGCAFPNGGHYEQMVVHVYDAAETDWKGTPHCKTGESRKLESSNPLTYDYEVPCCPDGATYNSGTNLCENADGEVVLPNSGGTMPQLQNYADIGSKGESMGMKIAAGVLLGVVGITVITGMGSGD